MNVLDRYCKRNGIVEHISDIEVVFTLRNFQNLIAGVVVSLTETHDNVVICRDRDLHLVKTAVTQHNHFSRQRKRQVIEVVAVGEGQRHINIGIPHILTLHIGKKMLVQVILHVMRTNRQTLQGQLEFCKFSHF